jgi:hypothetical protein
MLLARIKTGEVDMKKHINNFHDEMKDVAVHEHALFILFDEDVEKLVEDYFARFYPVCRLFALFKIRERFQ